jgi:hypothetical protein
VDNAATLGRGRRGRREDVDGHSRSVLAAPHVGAKVPGCQDKTRKSMSLASSARESGWIMTSISERSPGRAPLVGRVQPADASRTRYHRWRPCRSGLPAPLITLRSAAERCVGGAVPTVRNSECPSEMKSNFSNGIASPRRRPGSRPTRYPVRLAWIPAFAGMTGGGSSFRSRRKLPDGH